MKISHFLLLISFPIIFSVSLDEALNNLKTLESYIAEYKTEKQSSKSLNHLILSFIRQGKYDDTTWTLVAGDVPKDLYPYIQEKDNQHGTKTLECRKYGDIELPSKKKMDLSIYLL